MLLGRFDALFSSQVAACGALFYDTSANRAHGDAIVEDPTLPFGQSTVGHSSGYFLADPYEGEMLQFVLDLFWAPNALGSGAIAAMDAMWVGNRAASVAVSYDGPSAASAAAAVQAALDHACQRGARLVRGRTRVERWKHPHEPTRIHVKLTLLYG